MYYKSIQHSFDLHHVTTILSTRQNFCWGTWKKPGCCFGRTQWPWLDN